MNFGFDWLIFNPFFLVKLFIFLFEFLYLAFAVILLRQEALMRQTIEIPVSSFFQLLVFFNLIGSILLLILSFVFL